MQLPSSSCGRSPDDHFSGHLRMNGAKVGILAGFREGVRKLFVGIENLGFEGFFGAHDGMRDVVAIDPGNRGSRWYGDGRRAKGEIVNFHLAVEGGFSCALAMMPLCLGWIPPRPITAATIALAISTLFLMFFSPLIFSFGLPVCV